MVLMHDGKQFMCGGTLPTPLLRWTVFVMSSMWLHSKRVCTLCSAHLDADNNRHK